MAVLALDIDGTIDSEPVAFQSLMARAIAAGDRVVVLTGCSAKTVTQAEWDEKAAYLTKLGVGNCWSEMFVFADPPHEAKAQWCAENMGAGDLLFENSIQNAQLCSAYTTVCLVWNSKCD